MFTSNPNTLDYRLRNQSIQDAIFEMAKLFEKAFDCNEVETRLASREISNEPFELLEQYIREAKEETVQLSREMRSKDQRRL